jgi:hypothetical protein
MGKKSNPEVNRQGVRNLDTLTRNIVKRRVDICKHKFEYEGYENVPKIGPCVRVERCPFCGKIRYELNY